MEKENLIGSSLSIFQNNGVTSYYEKSKINKFIDSIFVFCESIKEIDDNVINVNKIMLLLKLYEINFIQFLSLIKNRQFKKLYVLDSIPNFKGLYFEKKEIDNFLKELKNRRIERLGYSTSELRIELKMSDKSIEKLILNGTFITIDRTIYNKKKPVRYISKSQVEDYKKRIVQGIAQ